MTAGRQGRERHIRQQKETDRERTAERERESEKRERERGDSRDTVERGEGSILETEERELTAGRQGRERHIRQ